MEPTAILLGTVNCLKKLLWALLNYWASALTVYVSIHIMREKLDRYARTLHGRLLDVGAGSKPYRDLFPVDQYIGVNVLDFYIPNIPSNVNKNTDVWVDASLPLPLASNIFDAVVCFQVLSVIADPQNFFRELSRLVKPGGYLLLSTDFLYPKWAENDHLRHTDVSLRSLAQTTGFEVIAIESFGSWLTTVHSLLMRYIRDYPYRIHQTPNVVRKLSHLLIYICWMAWMPVFAAIGFIALLIEGRSLHSYTFTMNLLLVARRHSLDDFSHS